MFVHDVAFVSAGQPDHRILRLRPDADFAFLGPRSTYAFVWGDVVAEIGRPLARHHLTHPHPAAGAVAFDTFAEALRHWRAVSYPESPHAQDKEAS